MVTVNTGDNRYGVAQFIVGKTIAEGANYTTVQSAIDAAVSGQTIFVRPGTYTENLTLKAGVSIVSWANSYGSSPPCIIKGKATFAPGVVTSCSFDNICFETNADYAFDISTNSFVYFYRCSFIQNSHLFLIDSTTVYFFECNMVETGPVGAIFTCTNNATVRLMQCHFSSTTTTASTFATGSGLDIENSFFSSHITTSNTSIIDITNSTLGVSNNTWTLNGTGAHEIYNSLLLVGNGTLSIGAGANLKLINSVIESNNANAISGAGTITYSELSFTGASSVISTTTQVLLDSGPRIQLGGTGGGCQILSGTGSPNTIITAPKGSLFLRTDGSTVNDRAYINTDNATAWTAVITAG